MIDRSALSEEVFAHDLLFWSHDAVHAVCRLLRRYPYREISAPPPILRPRMEERREYRDGGDIWVLTPEGKRQRFEVKRRKEWHGQMFPWESVIVDEAAGWQAKDPRPQGYFICNAPLSRTLYIACSTYEQWFLQRKFDHRYGSQEIDFLLAPVEVGTYYDL